LYEDDFIKFYVEKYISKYMMNIWIFIFRFGI